MTAINRRFILTILATTVATILCLLLSGSCMAAEGRLTKDETRIFATLPLDSLSKRGYTLLMTRKPENIEEALRYFIVGAERTDHLDDSSTDEATMGVRCLVNAAYILNYRYYDYPESYRLLARARDLAIHHNLNQQLTNIYLNLGVLFSNCSMTGLVEDSIGTTEAVSNFMKSFDVGMACRNYSASAFAIYDIADIGLDSDSTMLRDLTSRYLALDSIANYPLKTYMEIMCAGIKFHIAGDYISAGKKFREMRGHVSRSAYPELWNESKYFEAVSAERAADLGKAESLYLEIHADSLFHKPYHNRIFICRKLEAFYRRHDRTEEAENMSREAYLAKDSLLMSSGNGLMGLLQVKADMNDFRIDLLKSNQREKRNRMLWIGSSIGALLIIIILTMTLVNSIRRRRHITHLYEMNRQIIAIKENEAKAVLNSCEPEPPTGERPETSDQSSGYAHVDRDLLGKVTDVIENDPEVFSPEFSMSHLCAKVGANSKYVSHVINIGLGRNFKSLLLERRIREACRLLSDNDSNSRYSIEGIAREAGFKSKSTFNTAFKTTTGLTPGEYRTGAKNSRGQE